MRPRLARRRRQAQALLAWDQRPARGSTPRAGRLHRANAPAWQHGHRSMEGICCRSTRARDLDHDGTHLEGAFESFWPYGWRPDHDRRLPGSCGGATTLRNQGRHATTELGHLRTVLRWAEKHGLIARAPYIERPPAPKPQERHLARDQVRALIQACDLPHLKLFVHLAYATAGRSSALLGLTWDRCDFERGKINLEDPTIDHPHKGRAIVPMTDGLRIALIEAHRGALTDFVIEWAGKRVASVKRGIKAAGLRADVGKVTPHMLRHSAAVRMAEDGVPMEEIAQYLGHSNVNVTRRVYARFSPDYLRNAARALELDDLGPLRPKDHYVRKGRSADSIDEIMVGATGIEPVTPTIDRKSTRLNSSHLGISY